MNKSKKYKKMLEKDGARYSDEEVEEIAEFLRYWRISRFSTSNRRRGITRVVLKVSNYKSYQI